MTLHGSTQPVPEVAGEAVPGCRRVAVVAPVPSVTSDELRHRVRGLAVPLGFKGLVCESRRLSSF